LVRDVDQGGGNNHVNKDVAPPFASIFAPRFFRLFILPKGFKNVR
jgi:hypothetical protein